MNIFRTAAIATGVLLATPALAQDVQTIYLNPFVGYQHFDDKRDLENSATYGIGIEYRFLPQWAVEAVYSNSEADRKYVGGDTTFKEFRADGLYYFGTQEDRLNPYLAAGIGHADFGRSPLRNAGANHDETRANVGGGLRYNVNDRLSLRGDLRGFHGLDESTFDAQVSAGVSLAFSRSTAAPTPAAPEPAPKPPADGDNDGVPDSRDRCPGTPAGVQVDQNGCERDSDNDGVVDRKDECPNTTAGAKVDASGCEGVTETVETVNLLITFALNSDQITSNFEGEIRKVAEFMKANPETIVEIAGHSDSTGAADYNRDLSQRRAEAVAKRLISQYGIDGDRVFPVGYGESDPIASNDTAAGREQNRRVEARIQVRR